MNNYFILLAGWIIGQLTFTVIAAYLLQVNKSTIDYKEALGIFIKKETGNYVIALMALVIAMFVLSDYIDPKISRADLLNKAVLSWKEKVIVYSRTASVVFGIFCQFILLIVFKRGIRGISDVAAQNKVAIQNELEKSGVDK